MGETSQKILPNFMIVGDGHREGVKRILEEKTKYKVKTWPPHDRIKCMLRDRTLPRDRIKYMHKDRTLPKGSLEEQAKFDLMLKTDFEFKESDSEVSALQTRNEMRQVYNAYQDWKKTDEQVVGEWYNELNSEW